MDISQLIKYPTFTITLNKKDLTFRPWTVSERQILSMADASGELVETLKAMRQVINNCWMDADKNVNKLLSYEFEYVFLRLRMQSVGTTVSVNVPHPAEEGKFAKHDINLEDVKIFYPERHNNKIPLSDETGIVLRDPTIEDVIISSEEKVRNPKLDVNFRMTARCITQIYDGEDAIEPTNTIDELTHLLANLLSSQYIAIDQFFETSPRIRYEIDRKDLFPELKESSILLLEGIADFFG